MRKYNELTSWDDWSDTWVTSKPITYGNNQDAEYIKLLLEENKRIKEEKRGIELYTVELEREIKRLNEITEYFSDSEKNDII